jgi:hypothetical protein
VFGGAAVSVVCSVALLYLVELLCSVALLCPVALLCSVVALLCSVGGVAVNSRRWASFSNSLP